MSKQDPGFTEADRKAIAEIRRELDADFGPLEEVVPLDVRDDATDADVVHAPEARPWSSRPGVIAAFVTGFLLGALAGGVGTLAWLVQGSASAPQATRSVAEPPIERTTLPQSPPPPASDPALTSLRDALEAWLDATRRGDIPAQMRFYPGRVPVYYTWGDVPRDAVRAEKVKVFGAATTLEIDTGPPAIELAADGTTAVTSFRKRYVIEGPNIRRRGEVLQELRWERTTAGWMIVSERDARMLTAD